MNFDLRLSLRGPLNSSEGPGSSSDARAFLRELSNHLTETRSQAELRSLAEERDPELLGAGLRSFAGRQESGGRAELAAAIYQAMVESPATFSPAESALAQRRLNALRGQGDFGARFEIFARNFVQDVTNPANLAGMAFAGAVFQSLRLAAYARLLANPSANLLTRGLGARGIALGLGFLAEAPAFSLASRSVNAALGHPLDWSGRALGHELAATYLTLGALRLSEAGGTRLLRRLGNSEISIPGGLVRQTSMFGGIVAAQWLEQETGLRERTDSSSLLANSLATLLHFNAVGRLLHGLGEGGFTRRLRFQQNRLESLPRLEATPPWAPPMPAPALASADLVMMSRPSEQPPPMPGTESRGAVARPSSKPPPPRDVLADLTTIGDILSPLFDNREAGSPWVNESLEMIRLYSMVLDAVRFAEQRSEQPRPEIVNYLRDLTDEAELIGRMLEDSSRSAEQHPALSAEQRQVGQFLEHFYRSVNNFNNFMQNTGTIPEPLLHLRTARFWLQNGMEKALTNGDGLELPGSQGPEAATAGNPPYLRGEDGYYRIPGEEQHIIVIGDERGPRTFELMNLGHQVTHVEFDNSRLRTTQRLMDMKVERAKDSGQWRLNLPNAGAAPKSEFHVNIQNAQPADYVEAYFPTIFDTLRPRHDSRRMEQLRELIVTNLTLKLKPGGTAFVISDRDDAVEDLSKVLGGFPGLELLELRQRRNSMPLRAGMHVTAEPGENLYSWLIFRKRGE